MFYYKAVQDNEGLWLVEEQYDQRYCMKSESVFTISNSYVGIRGGQDFKGLVESRGMFVSGFYHKATPEDVIELVNCPDIMMNEVIYDGQMLSLDSVLIETYERKFNTDTGELRFTAMVKTSNGNRIKIESNRFVSMCNVNFACQKVKLTLLEGSIESIKVKTGVNGQVSNHGASHFSTTDCRVLGQEFLYFDGVAGNEGIEILERIDINFPGKTTENYGLERRSIFKTASGHMNEGDVLTIEKVAAVRLLDDETKSEGNFDKCKKFFDGKVYMSLFDENVDYLNKFWEAVSIDIEGAAIEDIAAIKYAQLQLYGMTPRDGGISSIASKGLSGEGYKGHVFWDTELFMLPFYIHTIPEIARDLLIYRFRGLSGAREKAREYGYQGAMYPWESAKDGREETPLFSALNIHTGRATPVWSGRKEHHIVADIGYAIIDYYQATGDEEFIEKYGLEMLSDISLFWVSRATDRNGRLEILDTIGPDEYTEHIDNNAFTNYMAKYVVEVTLSLMEEMGPGLYTDEYEKRIELFRDFCNRVYLPLPNEDGIIPQDDTFLSKPELTDINEFKGSPIKQAVLLKHSRDEVVDSQVLKQADVVMLLNLFPSLVEKELLRKNVEFYEARTLHDSSLSYCAHAQACANVGLTEMAFGFFRKALEVDLCVNPMDSRDGLHAASLGGIWNCIIKGFAGLSTEGGVLKLNPHLPAEWKSIAFTTAFNGKKYRVKVTDGESTVTPLE